MPTKDIFFYQTSHDSRVYLIRKTAWGSDLLWFLFESPNSQPVVNQFAAAKQISMPTFAPKLPVQELSGAFIVELRGWPLRYMYIEYLAPPGSIKAKTYLDIPWVGGRNIPTSVISTNLLIMFIIWFVIFMALLYGLWQGRRLLRNVQGRCPECGYSLRGAGGIRCPECGYGSSHF
jgi:hypothetical protein